MVNQAEPNGQDNRHKNNRNLIIALWGLVGLFLLGMLGYVYLQPKPNPCRDGVVIAGKSDMAKGDFDAVDETGKTINQDDLLQGWSLVYFGYSFCPDVCPIDAARNAEITDILASQGTAITPIFITVDPKRDTPEVLNEYTEYMHPKMIGVTGSEAQIERLKTLFKVYSEAEASDDPDYYLVNHTAFSYLMKGKEYITAYARSQRAEEIAANIQCQIEHNP